MTYEEALNYNQKWTAEQARNDLERYLLRNEPCAYKAIALAMQALEKQMPQKVRFEDDGDALICPRCGFDLMGCVVDAEEDPHYCLVCGQALDWSRDWR